MIKIPVHIIQEVLSGIPAKPKIFSNGSKARETFLELAWIQGYKNKKAINMSIENLLEEVDDFLKNKDYSIKWWQDQIELN